MTFETKRHKLTDLIDVTELNSFLENVGNSLGTCCAIVKCPSTNEEAFLTKYEDYLVAEGKIPDVELLEIMKKEGVYLNKQYFNITKRDSPFCKKIRDLKNNKSPIGDWRCIYCDYVNSNIAFKKRDAYEYTCHAGLVEIVAPIVAGDKHIANIFIGQNYKSIDLNKLDKIFNDFEIGKLSTYKDFLKDYESLQMLHKRSNEIPLSDFKKLLSDLARLLSMHVTTKLNNLIFPELWYKTQIGNDIREFLKELFLIARDNAVDYDSASVWIKRNESPGILECLYHDYPPDGVNIDELINRGIQENIGLAEKIINNNSSVLHLTNKVDLTDEAISNRDVDMLRQRELGTFLGVQLKKNNKVFGFIEIGSKVENAFWPETIRIIEEVARYVSLFFNFRNDFEVLFRDKSSSNDQKYFSKLLIGLIPRVLNSLACSIFWIDEENKYLLRCYATTGIEGIEPGDESTVVYNINSDNITCESIRFGQIIHLSTLSERLSKYPECFNPKFNEKILLPSGKSISSDEYAKIPVLIVPIISEENEKLGVFRVLGKNNGDDFNQSDIEFAKNLSVTIQHHSINPFSLLNIIKSGTHIMSFNKVEDIVYSFLTLITHGQGIGINRAILFEYVSFGNLLKGIYGIGPDRKQSFEYDKIDPLNECISNSSKNYKMLIDSKLNNKIQKVFPLTSKGECIIYDFIYNEKKINIFNLPDLKVSPSIKKLFSDLEIEYPTVAIIPVLNNKKYLLICDNIYNKSASFIKSADSSLLMTACTFYSKALFSIENEFDFVNESERQWKMFTCTTAHILGNKLPIIDYAISNLIKYPADKIDIRYWLGIQNRLKSALIDVKDLRQLGKSTNAFKLFTCEQFTMEVERYLTNTPDISFIYKWKKLNGLNLLLDIDRLFDCIDVFIKNVQDLDLEYKKEIVFEGKVVSKVELPDTLPTSDTYENYFIFSVKDNGPGIKKNILDKIFQPFLTSKSFGLGLGLPFVYRVVKQHNGYMIADNQKGSNRGAVFTLYLPIAMNNISDFRCHSKTSKRVCKVISAVNTIKYQLPLNYDQFTPDTNLPKMLIVEDNEYLSYQLYRMFTSVENSIQFNCILALSLEEFKERQKHSMFDVIIIDMCLWDKLTGWENDKQGGIFATEISNFWNSGSVIIVFTAQPSIEDCKNTMKKGAWDYIDKNEPDSFIKLQKSVIDGMKAKHGSTEWIEQKTQEFSLIKELAGKYIALADDGKLIGDDTDINVLLDSMRKQNVDKNITILTIPN